MKLKIWSSSILILFVFFLNCHSQKVFITKESHVVPKKVSNIYISWEDAVANNDFKSAAKFSISNDEKKLIKGYELLLNNKINKAEGILTDLWKTKSKYSEAALSVLYKYFFFHTEWEHFMKLVKITGDFPKGYNSVNDYYKFPKEKIVFPIEKTVIVPIKKFNSGKTPVIGVYVNGIKKYFIVDTGVSISAVSSEVAKECGLIKGATSMGMIDANNVTKKNSAIPSYIEELNISNMKIINHPVFISNNLKIKILGITVYKIDGIIGWNFLQKLKVNINYKKKEILFSRSVKNEVKEKRLFGIGTPFIAADLLNGKKIFLHFDTGANSISLSDNAQKKIEEKISSEKTITSFSVNKNKKIKVGVIKNFSFFIGDYKLNYPKINISKLKISPENLIHLDGRIGNSSFLNDSIIFDYQNGIFEILKNK